MSLRSFTDKLAEQEPWYFERVKSRGRTPNVFNDPRLMRRVFPEVTKERHAELARIRQEQADRGEAEYHQAIEDAIAKYGDVELGKHVSGIYNPNFPERVKDKLRSLKDYHVYRDAAQLHYNASGKRGAMPGHTWENLLPPGTRRG